MKDPRFIDDYYMMGNLKRLLGKLTVTVAAAATCALSAQPAWINDGLVAYYPFNGDADDQSGNGNDGDIIGGIFAGDRFGIDERSLNIPDTVAADSGLFVPVSGIPTGASDRTFSFWVKPNITIPPDAKMPKNRYLLSTPFNGAPGGNIAMFWVEDSPGYEDGSIQLDFSWAHFTTSGRLEYGKWSHLVISFRESVVSVWQDGEVLSVARNGAMPDGVTLDTENAIHWFGGYSSGLALIEA